MDTTKSCPKRQESHEDPPPLEYQQKKGKMSVCTPDQKSDNALHTRSEFLEMRRMIEAGMFTWSGPGNKKGMKHALGFTVFVQPFLIENAKSNPEDVDLLSESQKKTIISSLAGYCVQEKWDVLMGLVPDMLRGTILEIFLEALIYKDIFGRFFMAPFWYLDGKMSPSDEGDEMFSTRLQHLYDRFYETNPLMAALWRSETNRLANAMTLNKASSTLLGTHHRDRRQSFIGQFVDETLSSEPIKWLLKDPSSKEEEDKRYELLYMIYERAAEEAAKMGNIRGHIDFHTLAQLPETFTLGEADRMYLHEYNLCDYSDRVDGHRVLILVRPGIVRRYISAREEELTEFSMPAYVVVQESAEENKHK